MSEVAQSFGSAIDAEFYLPADAFFRASIPTSHEIEAWMLAISSERRKLAYRLALAE